MIRPTFSLATAAVTFACASAGNIPVIQSEYWKDEDFAAYQRYAWLPTDAHRREGTQAEDHRLHDLIREAIDGRVAGMGYVRSEAGDADFLVTYHCKIAEKLRADVIDHVWYGGEEGASWEEVTPRIELSTFDEGSIVIDFANAANGKRVWRGVAEQYEEIVDRSVREILSEFPPGRSSPERK